jgi:hypothetical protein
MEFASEMVVKATLARYRVTEVPTTLSPDGRSRPPHLRSWRDGWRYLRFLLLFSPRWLFLYPGLALLALGLMIGIAVTPGPLRIDGVTFDVDTLAVAAAMLLIGYQAVLFALFTQVYAEAEGFLPAASPRVQRLQSVLALDRGLLMGGLLASSGLAGLALSFIKWNGVRFGDLNYETALRVVVLSVTALILSCQVVLGAFFLSILGIRVRHAGAPGVHEAPGPRLAQPATSGANGTTVPFGTLWEAAARPD